MASKAIRYQEVTPAGRLYYEDTSFPEIRKCLAPQYQHLPAEYIEQIIEQSFGEGVSPEDIEGIFSDIGNFVKKTAKSVSKAMPSVGKAVAGALPSILPVAGTVVGTAFGGPLGGAVGGALGSTLGGVVGSAVSPAAKTAPRPVSATGTLGKLAGAAGAVLGAQPSAAPLGKLAASAGAALGGKPIAAGGSAAAQLLQTLLQPKVVQGLQAMALGSAGRQTIPVAGTQIPVSAIANLIGTLANQVAEEHHALQVGLGESDISYLLNAEGYPIVDPASPEQRASVILGLLQQESINQLHLQEQSQRLRPAYTAESAYDDWPEHQAEIDHYYDMLELASFHEDVDERELH